MLQDTTERAKFGWSHCLTQPQAACGLSSMNMERKLGLATTLVWVTAYRTITSKQAIAPDYRPEPVRGSLREALHQGPAAAAGRFWHGSPEEIDEIIRVAREPFALHKDIAKRFHIPNQLVSGLVRDSKRRPEKLEADR